MYRLTLVLLILAVAAVRGEADDRSPAPLDVSVWETPEQVVLRIRLPENVAPDSVEIQLAGPTVRVRVKDLAGKSFRSPELRVSAPLLEDDATAAYEGTLWLTVTLRKQQ